MNAVDLIVCLVLVLAVWNGWRQGFILQVCSLAGIVAGIWLAAQFGTQAGEWLRLDPGFAAAGGFVAVLVAGIWLAAQFGTQAGEWLRLDPGFAAAGGFVAVLVAVILVVAIAGRLVRKLSHFAGFGIADTLLGVAVSVLKYLLVLSVLFSAFDDLNEDYTLAGPETIEKSKSYKPVMHLSEAVFPFLEWVGGQVPGPDENTPSDGE